MSHCCNCFNLLKNQIYPYLFKYWRFLLLPIYISNLVLLACSYLNLSKNSSLTAFFRKADAKVRTFFWTTKTFQKKFSKKFFQRRFVTLTSFQYFNTHLRFSLESGCKITALQHILQTFETLFCRKFAFVYISCWLSSNRNGFHFWILSDRKGFHYLIIYTRAYTEKLYHNPSPPSP